ncbi:hypothetical protein D3C85_1217350 [compost metagenome]
MRLLANAESAPVGLDMSTTAKAPVNIGVALKQARLQVLADVGIEAHGLQQSVVFSVYSTSLDRIEQGQPANVSAQIAEHSKTKLRSEQWAASIRRRDTSSKNSKALTKLEGHPVMQTIAATGTDVAGLHKGTMSHSIKKIAQQYTLAQRVASLEQRMVAMEKAHAQHSTRLELVEGGQSWQSIAQRMRAEGSSYGAIAKVTGQTRDAVAGYIRRLGK